MHMHDSSAMNPGWVIAVACAGAVDLEGDSENLAGTPSVTPEILQESPFSTAC
jgi:hypothetical protein